MGNVVKFKPAEFVNIEGKPVGVSMKQLVLQGVPKAWCHLSAPHDPAIEESRALYTIRVPEFDNEPPQMQGFIGTGGTEEAAWRDAYFNLSGESR
jgi:hypothetical protein